MGLSLSSMGSFCGTPGRRHSLPHHVFRTHRVLSSLCVSHSPHLLGEALDCPALESPQRQEAIRGGLKLRQTALFGLARLVFILHVWVSQSFSAEDLPKATLQGSLLPGGHLKLGFKKKKLMGFFSGLTTCLNSDPFKRDL